LLELGSRLRPSDPEFYTVREQARALGWRLREHLVIESSALMADAGGANPHRAKALMAYSHERVRLDRAIAAAQQRSSAPLELVNATCTVVRDARAHLDRAPLA